MMVGLVQQVAVEQGERRLVTWIEDDKRVKVGTRLELKGENGVWRVTAVYGKRAKSQINRNWRVGGLD